MGNSMAIFLDASFLIALYSEDDVHHKRALELSGHISQYGNRFTSDDVVDEAVSVTLRKWGRRQSLEILNNIVGSLPIFTNDKFTFDKGVDFFRATPHNFSLTDCMILAVLEVTGTRHIVTFDKEFKKAEVNVVD